MSALDNLPVIIGAGQDNRPVPDDLDMAFGPVELAGEALSRAFKDAGIALQDVDVCFGVRLFGDSGPAFPNPFGSSNNVPASICARAGVSAGRYTYDHVGGQTPQTLVAEAAQLLMDGTAETVAIVGAEAIANIKAAGRAGAKPDWTEQREEPLDDRGAYSPGGFMVHMQAIAHRIAAPVYYYGLMECARRAALGETKDVYRDRMADIWGEFSKVAAGNEYAVVRAALSGADIVTPSPKNPMIASPYTKAMVARDGVNQGAAIIMTTYGKAKKMGVRDVTFLHGHDSCTEPSPIERANLHRAEAQKRVLENTGRDADMYDLYSCFPIVPLEAKRILGLDGTVPLTLTGGLPFFGGPGNNYSLHGIAEAHARVRGTDNTAVVYANGGLASKHAVGRYSGVAPDAVKLLKSQSPEPTKTVETAADPSGAIIAYTVEYRRGEPMGVVIMAETDAGARFYARGGVEQVGAFIQDDPVGQAIQTVTQSGQNMLTGI
jgi:acetyl-CoA C-acetyltransferase